MQRMIDCGTWDDPWFADLEPDAKLLFLYLLTNRRSTAAGAFEITLRAMSFETGLTVARIDAILAGFGERVRWWPQHQTVWVRNFFKRQAANEKFTISARRHIAELPLEIQRVIASVYPNLVPDGVSPDPDTHTNGYAMGISSIGIEESSNSVEEFSGEKSPDPPAADSPKPKQTKPEPPPKPEPGKPMPRNGPAQTLLAVLYEDVLKIGPPTKYGQAVGVAQRLVDVGCTPEELTSIAAWLLADPWQADKGVTISRIESNRDNWRAAQSVPAGMTVHHGGKANGRASPNGEAWTPERWDRWRRDRGIADDATADTDDVIETTGVAQ